MARKRHTPEQIIRRLREAEVALVQGQTVARVCRSLGVAEQLFYIIKWAVRSRRRYLSSPRVTRR
jgi:transposase-like protein